MFERSRSRFTVATLLAALAAAVLLGPGAAVGSASVGSATGLAAKTPKPLSRGSLAANGDDICRAHSKTIATKFERLSKKAKNKPSQAQLVAFVRSTVVPEIGASFDALAKLLPPPAEAAAFRDAIATGRRELAAVERDPTLSFGSTNPFAATAKKFKALGFKNCAQS